MHQPTRDIHHIVLKHHLQTKGVPGRGDYDQVESFALTETSITLTVANKPPLQCMAEVAAGAHRSLDGR